MCEFKPDVNTRSDGRLLNGNGRDIKVNDGHMNRGTFRDHFSPRRITSMPKHQSSSPISIHDADDFLVQDTNCIVPFSQESIKSRLADLQSIAMTSIPDVSSIPKLLKSHNMAFKKDKNASTCYQRFHNFCAMIGIYLPPPKAMEKSSIMGKEWDNNALPKVFYSRFEQMKKVLSHILFSPGFFPKEFQDDLQLNPDPNNFLRLLFMALNSHAVPDLSDRVIKRPGVVKSSQSLSQYALLWVNYIPMRQMSMVSGIQSSSNIVTSLMDSHRNIPSYGNSWRWSLNQFMILKWIIFQFLSNCGTYLQLFKVLLRSTDSLCLLVY
jgi:hypothetical protein